MELVTEDGGVVDLAGGALPPDLPFGYHTLRPRGGGEETPLIASPGCCHLPPDLRAWGWAVQLYALRSSRSWGVGDLADLRELGAWSRGLGARALLVSPLHAPLPGLPQEPSPYFPSSRRLRNPLHIRVEDVTGAQRLGATLAPARAVGRALNGARRIDRDEVLRLKTGALEELFAAFAGDDDFERYRAREGRGLTDYATFCAISERLGSPWTAWPAGLRHPDSHEVREFRTATKRRVRFHEWLQWLVDQQLARAGSEIGLIQDLAIGTRADGADAWMWRDAFAPGIRVGAPPDPFNAAGQDWGLAPFDPWRLRAAAYEPFVQTLRAAFRHGTGLRVDHVMGLFRLFWIAEGASPAHGVYVRYPHQELLDIVALESHRAGAYVIGEDLGTVEPAVRAELAARAMLCYRLVWFEEQPPGEYPPQSMAALTTHDLPTLAGVWEGSDSDPAVLDRLRRITGLWNGESTEHAADLAHRALAGSPSRLVTATLEDALGVVERPNKPGTITEWPNWSLALPASLEELTSGEGPARIARSLRRDPPEGPVLGVG
jgi:4-alpha-glucanotransferase